MRILIADDDPDNRRLLSILLQRLGHEVAASGDGQEALELWLEAQDARRPYDAALVDLDMPRLGGLGFASRLREAEASLGSARTALIAVSGGALTPRRQLCEFDEILGKPYTVEELALALTIVGA